MRLFGKKFIPGVRVDVDDTNNEEENLKKTNNHINVTNNGSSSKDILDTVSESTATTYEPNSEEPSQSIDLDEKEQFFNEGNDYETSLETFEAFTSILNLNENNLDSDMI